jgi:nucleoid DNA-binding protein
VKRSELVEKVVSETGLKKGEVKRALDAAFAAIRANLLQGNDTPLPGLGKIKVRERAKGDAAEPGEDARLVYRFRLSSDAEAKGEAKADADAESDAEPAA